MSDRMAAHMTLNNVLYLGPTTTTEAVDFFRVLSGSHKLLKCMAHQI
jgi:hypothetical protein